MAAARVLTVSEGVRSGAFEDQDVDIGRAGGFIEPDFLLELPGWDRGEDAVELGREGQLENSGL